MVDANQSLTSAEARRRARCSSRLDLDWIEEPLPGRRHRRSHAARRVDRDPDRGRREHVLARAVPRVPGRGAAGIVQADVARIGGITPWLKVAHLAEAFNVEVARTS